MVTTARPASDAEIRALAARIFARLPPAVAIHDPPDTSESPLDRGLTDDEREKLYRNIRVLALRSF